MYDDRQTLGAKKLPGLTTNDAKQTMNAEAKNGNTGVAPKDSTSTGNTDPNNAQSEIGRAQKAYQEYKAQGRDDLAQNAHDYAQSQRDMYTKSGGNASNVDPSKDLTSMYKGNVAGAYDVNKPGEQVVTQAQARPAMTPGLSYADALARARGQYDPLRQDSLRTLGNQYQTDRGNIDQMSAARGVGHSGLVVDEANKAAAGNQAAIAKANASYDSQIASAATQLQQQDWQNQFNKWNADNGNFNSDRGFNYQQGRDQVGDRNWQSQFDLQKAMSEAGMTGQYNGASTMAKQFQDFQQKMAESGMTGKYNGDWTQQARLAYAQMYGKDPVTGQTTTNVDQFNQSMNNSNYWNQANMNNSNYWQNANMQYDQAQQNRNYGLQKVGIIAELNKLSTASAAVNLQGLVSQGVFTQQEAEPYLRYWQTGQAVPKSELQGPWQGPVLPGKP